MKSCVKDFIEWSLWFSRTWKMKMPWAAMATPLSVTSSRSGRTCSLVCCSFFFSPVFFVVVFFWSLCTKIIFCLPCSDPATLSYCSSQWSFSTLSSVSQLSARCCGYAHRDAQTRRQGEKKMTVNLKMFFLAGGCHIHWWRKTEESSSRHSFFSSLESVSFLLYVVQNRTFISENHFLA